MTAEPEFSDTQSDNTYVIDTESAAEMARLMRQEQSITTEIGGLFPEKPDLSEVHHILDVGCGPGGWVLETAFTYADIDVTGVDISDTMITYARAQARVQGLTNAHFEIMNVLKPFPYGPASFDLVNARSICGFMPPRSWPAFLAECLRILRPGGLLRITDFEWGLSNKAAFEKYCWLFNQAFQRAGQSFSQNGLFVGILPVLRHLLLTAGCVNVSHMAHAIDCSYGTRAYAGYVYNYSTVFKLLQPFIMRYDVATQKELDDLYVRAMEEMQSEDFCSIMPGLTVWGYKAA